MELNGPIIQPIHLTAHPKIQNQRNSLFLQLQLNKLNSSKSGPAYIRPPQQTKPPPDLVVVVGEEEPPLAPRSPTPMESYKERVASLRQTIASGGVAARPEAAPPDPRRKAALHQAAASLQERMAAQLARLGHPFPALAAARSLAEQTLPRQEQLKALRSQNRDLQSQLHQTLSIKSRKESEYKRISESISNSTSMNGKLKDSLMELRNKRDTYATVISDQFQDLENREAKTNKDATLRENLEAAASWFNKFLGWHVLVEEGVKFVFDKIDLQCPEKECSFCIKIENDTYYLVQCDPAINDFDELVKDLNLNGDLLKFLKVARERFQASSVNGNLPISSVACPDVPSLLPFSPPVTTTVSRTSEDVPNQSNSQSKNKRLPAKRRGNGPSPGSTRHSPLLLEGLHQREG